jgi:hypothetical protein
VILFYPLNDYHGKRLEKAVVPIIQREKIIVVHKVESLLKLLTQPNNKHRVLLFLAASTDQLEHLSRNIALLDNLKKILVLPEDSKTIRHTACTLYPSYITNVFSDYKDIQDVLIKIKSRLPGL